MKSYEELVDGKSEYFVSLPSLNAREMFFYPLYTGHFYYKKGYLLHRDSYDSFLLMYVKQGAMLVTANRQPLPAPEGSFVFLDCYAPHSYQALQDTETLWCHFDGPTARAYFQAVTASLGNIFSLSNAYPVISKLESIYQAYASGKGIREALLSKYLNDILTAFLLYHPLNIRSDSPLSLESSVISETAISYISEHFKEDLSVEMLADKVGLSQYHFIRLFKKETGFTPHEYLINIRINTAKYLLKNSRLPVKEICYQSGFSCESVFCSSFKKRMGMTPVAYRQSDC